MGPAAIPLAILGAGGLGAGAAVISSKQQSSAVKKAAETAKESGDTAAAVQLEMFYKQLEMQEPFRQAALDDLYYLSQPKRDFQMAQMGFGVDVMDYQRQQMGYGMDTMDYNRIRMGFGLDQMDYARLQMGLGLEEMDYSRDRMSYGRDIMGFGRERMDIASGAMQDLQRLANEPFELSDAFRIQQEEGELALSRALGARGLQGSGAAIKSLENFNRKLLATEADKYRNRQIGILGQLGQFGLAGGPNLGSTALGGGGLSAGGAGALGMATIPGAPGVSGGGLMGAGYQQPNYTGLGTNLANISMWQGAQQSNAALQQGQIGANMWSNIGNIGMQGLGSYLGYQQNQNLMNMMGGGFGGGSGGGSDPLQLNYPWSVGSGSIP